MAHDDTWLLIKSMPNSVIISFVFFSAAKHAQGGIAEQARAVGTRQAALRTRKSHWYLLSTILLFITPIEDQKSSSSAVQRKVQDKTVSRRIPPSGLPEAAVPRSILTGAPPGDQPPFTEPCVCAVCLAPVTLLQLLPAVNAIPESHVDMQHAH